MNTRVEVRCCCQPQKLLGWLEVDEYRVRSGERIRFAIPSTMRGNVLVCDQPLLIQLVETITLPLEKWGEGAVRKGIAFKSEETPIEQLRRIPGFIEAGQP